MIEEKIVVGEGTEFPLNGILSLPENPTSDIPAVVLVHGSGSSDMNEAVMAVTPFKDIAELFAERGIASIRYDKRTYAHGRKAIKDRANFTIREETIEDAILATQMLRNDPRIGKVFIFGHSLGGMQAGRIDAEGGNFDGLIIAAGTARSLREVMRDQSKENLYGTKGIVTWLNNKATKIIQKKFDSIDTMTDEEAKQKKLIGGVSGYYLKDMEANLPAKYLTGIDKPVLVFQGDKDFQVSVEKDFEGFRQILDGNPNATLKIYPGLNHVFTDSVATGTIKDYKVPSKVDAHLMDDVASWIHSVE